MTSLTRTPSERRRARAYVHAAIRPRRTRSRARGRRRPSAAGLCTWCSSSGGRARGSTEALHPWCFKTARLAIGPQALASAESARNAFRELLTLRRRQRLAKVWIKFYNIINSFEFNSEAERTGKAGFCASSPGPQAQGCPTYSFAWPWGDPAAVDVRRAEPTS